METRELTALLELWRSGAVPDAGLLEQLRLLMTDAPRFDDVSIDLDRAGRCGAPEVVYAPGKSIEAISAVFEAQQQAGQRSLATRVSPEQAEAVCGLFPSAVYNPLARTVSHGAATGHAIAGRVLVITAGTTDRPVAEEALETARWLGCDVELLTDVGVAGPHRLFQHRQRLQSADAIVVVAGMEGALPSVVAGWVSAPVIGVPTSVGYGANFGGFSALLSMLNSCAANVCVVNIDAGFKGGYLAGGIARRTVAS